MILGAYQLVSYRPDDVEFHEILRGVVSVTDTS